MLELLRETLENILPSYFITRGDNNPDCIVYNYISKPVCYADNDLKGTEYTILINIICTSNVENYKKQVINALLNAKFKGGNVQATKIESKEIEGDTVFNTAITFKYYEKEGK